MASLSPIRLVSRFAIVSLVALWPACGSPAADEAADDDLQPIVYLGEREPLLVHLRVRIDGKGFRKLPQLAADALMGSLDLDRDGWLDGAELEAIPTPDRFGRGDAAGGPPRTRIDAAGLADYLRTVQPVPVVLQAGAGSSEGLVPMFGPLDANQDGRLSVDELLGGSRSLSKRDLDDDETFTAAEIAPQLLLNGGGRPKLDDVPLETWHDESSQRSTAERLARLYPHGPETPASVPSPRVPPGEAASLWQEWLTAAPAAADIEIDLPLARTTMPAVKAQSNSPRVILVKPAGTRDTRRAALQIDGIGMEWRGMAGGAGNRSSLAYFQSQFRIADADKNGYLSPAEFPTLNAPGGRFADYDADRDGKLTTDELARRVRQDLVLSKTRIVITASAGAASLFDLFDANGDRRISPREFQEIATRIRKLDVNGDGELTATEMFGNIRVSVGLGEPVETGRQAAVPAMMRVGPRAAERYSGPAWFRKMDANRDGDVSRREYLGPPETFSRLDRDGNGLISVDEATGIDRE